MQRAFSWAPDDDQALEGARVWKGAQPKEFYREDWHEPGAMYEHGEEEISDDDLREAMIISADPDEHVSRVRQVEEMGATTVALMNNSGADPHRAIETYGSKVLPSLRPAAERSMSGYSIVSADDVDDTYAGTDVPGEFRSLKDALGAEQLAVTLIRVPPHSDFEQGTGHSHEQIEEIYIVTRGRLTMRLGEETEQVDAGAAVRIAPDTVRSHRNEADEPVEMWAISKRIEGGDSVKVDDFWEASPKALRHR